MLACSFIAVTSMKGFWHDISLLFAECEALGVYVLLSYFGCSFCFDL